MQIKSRAQAKRASFYTIFAAFIGACLGTLLVYYFKGFYPYEVLFGGILMTIILLIIHYFKFKWKSPKAAVADERTQKNISRYFAFMSHTFLAILLISLLVMVLFDITSLSINYLWLFFFAYILLGGIGAKIVKKR